MHLGSSHDAPSNTMGVDDLKILKIETKKPVDSQSLAEELLVGGDVESIDWNKTDARGFTVLHCLLSISKNGMCIFVHCI
jgi:hypothetical protein